MTLSLKLTTRQCDVLAETISRFRLAYPETEEYQNAISRVLLEILWDFEYRLAQRRVKLKFKPLKRKPRQPLPVSVMQTKPGEIDVLWAVLKVMPYDTERQSIFAQLDQIKVNL